MFQIVFIALSACAVVATMSSTGEASVTSTGTDTLLPSTTAIASTTAVPSATATKTNAAKQTTDSPTTISDLAKTTELFATTGPAAPTPKASTPKPSSIRIATTKSTPMATKPATPSATTTISPLILRTLQYNPDQQVGGGLCWPENPNACSFNGMCIKDQHGAHSECHCFAQYGGFACETKQKSQLVAFLLALLLGWLGAGRFYLGYIAAGIFKLFYYCGFLILVAVSKAMLKEGSEPHPVIALFSCCCCCGWLIWWIHDVVVIGTGSLTAVDGIGMYLNL